MRGIFCHFSGTLGGSWCIFGFSHEKQEYTGLFQNQFDRPTLLLRCILREPQTKEPRSAAPLDPLCCRHSTQPATSGEVSPALRSSLSRDSLTGVFPLLPATGVFSGDLHIRLPSISVHHLPSPFFPVVSFVLANGPALPVTDVVSTEIRRSPSSLCFSGEFSPPFFLVLFRMLE